MKKKLIIAVIVAASFIVGGVVLLRYTRANEVVTVGETAPEAQQSITEHTDAPAEATQSTNEVTGHGYPVSVQVLEADIDVPVAKGYYNKNTQKWTISRDKAYFATMTKRPNTTSGNTFIYGHNRSNMFSRLLSVKPGSIAVVTTDKNERFTYRLQRSFTTKPEDSSILYYQGPPILTLQTCSGAAFQNRTIFVFELIGARHA